VSVDPTSVRITGRAMVSDPITVTAGHDRNVSSDEVEITATASGHANYRGATGAVAVTAVDDDYSLTSDVASVTEKSALSDVNPVWVTFFVTAPPGGTVSRAAIQLGVEGSADYVFTPVILVGSRARPYNPDADRIPMITPVRRTTRLSTADVWLVASDDNEDEELETIQIGADPTGEEGRIEPVMITVVDADPEVTLSIDAVDEGADEVTMTITATAAGPMPGIFEIPADRWDIANAANLPTGFELVASGTLTIDRNETEGTVTVTVTAPDDADKEDAMFKIGLTTNQVVALGGVENVDTSVGMLEVTVTDDDKDNGGG
jgi:hypothetical protein